MKKSFPRNDIGSKDDVFHKEIIETFFGKSLEQCDITVKDPVPSTKIPDIAPEDIIKPEKPSNKRLFLLLTILIGILIAYISQFFALLPHHSRQTDNIRIYSDEEISDKIHNFNYQRAMFNGIYDHDIFSDMTFNGDALANSLILANSIKLSTTNETGKASIFFQLLGPVDLTGVNILILAKSAPGARSMFLAIHDGKGEKYSIPLILSKRWEWYDITLTGKKKFDLTNVSAMSFECGSDATGNQSDTEIFLKEIGFRNI